jgi:Zn-finger nucleic acid-binding protein
MASAQASPETPICPSCQTPLALGANGLTGFWSCPNGHGAACTVTAAYGHVQDEEIRAIWQASAQGQPGSRACPMCGRPMVEVSVDAATAAGAQAAKVAVDVCRDDELFWLDAGEVDQLPKSAPAAAPSVEEEQNFAAIRKSFDDAVDEGIREQHHGLFDRMTDRIAERHPAFPGLVTHATYRSAADDLDADLHPAPAQPPADSPAAAQPPADPPPAA